MIGRNSAHRAHPDFTGTLPSCASCTRMYYGCCGLGTTASGAFYGSVPDGGDSSFLKGKNRVIHLSTGPIIGYGRFTYGWPASCLCSDPQTWAMFRMAPEIPPGPAQSRAFLYPILFTGRTKERFWTAPSLYPPQDILRITSP